jgi:ABC-type transporter Mla subunit MlaD
MRRKISLQVGRWLGRLAPLWMAGCATWPMPSFGIGAATPSAGIRSGVVQTGAAVPEQGVARKTPTVTGSQLQLKPDETAAERALELSRKLTAAEEEKKVVAYRVRELEGAVNERDRALQERDRIIANASSEFQAATAELNQAREQLKRLKTEVANLHESLRGAEKDNLATLQSIATCLEQVLQHDKQVENGKENADHAGPALDPSSLVPTPKRN